MHSFRLLLASALLALVTVSAEAGVVEPVNIGLNDVIATVEKSYTGPLQSVTADFAQRSTLAAKERELRAVGQMFLKTATANAPLMFRFDYFRPTTQQIFCDGKTLWMYLPENRQVILSDVSFVFNPFNFDPSRDRATNFLQGLGRISKDFQINFSSQRQDIDGNYILELTPRRASVSIEKLFVVVNRSAVMLYVQGGRNINVLANPSRPELLFPVLSTTMVDHQGNTTLMEFSNIKTNVWLADSLFKFVIPAGVQVVRPPRGGQ